MSSKEENKGKLSDFFNEEKFDNEVKEMVRRAEQEAFRERSEWEKEKIRRDSINRILQTKPKKKG